MDLLANEAIVDRRGHGGEPAGGLAHGRHDHLALPAGGRVLVLADQFLPLMSNDVNENHHSSVDYIFEPSEEYIVSELIPQSLKIKFYKTILESNASEHGARMTAMEQATENADELLSDLKITYNRTRQAAITKEILEIVGGADALSQ